MKRKSVVVLLVLVVSVSLAQFPKLPKLGAPSTLRLDTLLAEIDTLILGFDTEFVGLVGTWSRFHSALPIPAEAFRFTHTKEELLEVLDAAKSDVAKAANADSVRKLFALELAAYSQVRDSLWKDKQFLMALKQDLTQGRIDTIQEIKADIDSGLTQLAAIRGRTDSLEKLVPVELTSLPLKIKESPFQALKLKDYLTWLVDKHKKLLYMQGVVPSLVLLLKAETARIDALLAPLDTEE